MKLPTKPEFFDRIKRGDKRVEYRDAHITFINEETGETITRQIKNAYIMDRSLLPDDLRGRNDLFTNNQILKITLK